MDRPRVLNVPEVAKLDGRAIDMKDPEILAAARRAVRDPVSIMMNGIKGAWDIIDMVVMVGGHPSHYAEEIAERMPDMPIYVPKHSVFRNVEGLQLIGEGLGQGLAERHPQERRYLGLPHPNPPGR
ncbi:hypothetical protein QTI17_02335 [Variovorax sp. J31P179]|uniref:hypothetical protein n=1 Tax=Variovorax sp. J31P179 TaxID=3053508 RepID=UPI002574FA1F|nr:hypothetical protein [Variovorax sp. J31P179]MDM0079421.1 hypothetical protein [Variovorax sp. J31P179]